MRLLIAGGGTGGHIYPALAVARSLRALPDAPDVRWLGGHRGLEASIVKAAGIPFQRLLVRSLRTVERDVHLVLDPLRLGASVPQAAAILARDRPAAILTTGGYAAIPVMLAAAPLRTLSHLLKRPGAYSHSMVEGGFEETSSATRFTPRTSLMIRLETRSRRS